MKRLFALFLLSLACSAFAQKIDPSQIKPNYHGMIRKSPCSSGAGDACGDNPPTFQITPAMCGLLFSTSSAKNEDGSVSTQGVKFILPTVADMTAAGYTPGGAFMSNITNREGQCRISFVMGAPEANYLRLGVEDLGAAPKGYTTFANSAYDLYTGEIVFPYLAGAVITVDWNGNSWLWTSGSPMLAELLGIGQRSAHAQGRLFYVTTDPSWSTVGTLIGNLAYCPHNGNGLVTNANGGYQLSQLPQTCIFHAPTAGGPVNEWLVAYNVTTGTVTNVTQGDAYASGTAPDGTAYAAGNYVRLHQTGFVNMQSGNTIEVHNVTMTDGTQVDGKWIVKKISATEIELHQRVTPQGISAPSSFVSGDTWVSGGNSNYMALTINGITNPYVTEPSTGVDRENTTGTGRTLVGVARRGHSGFSGLYQDTATLRLVASRFNPVEKKCINTFTTNRTVTSTTFVEVNSEIRCNFIYMSGTSATGAGYGDVGRPVKFAANIEASNGTASNGCEFSIGFNGTTAETEVTGFTNPAGESGNIRSVTLAGSKSGLTESNHYITLLARAVTGGTCTIYSGTTSISATIWQ